MGPIMSEFGFKFRICMITLAKNVSFLLVKNFVSGKILKDKKYKMFIFLGWIA